MPAIELVLTGAEFFEVVLVQFGTKEVNVVIASLALLQASFCSALVVRETKFFISRGLAASC